MRSFHALIAFAVLGIGSAAHANTRSYHSKPVVKAIKKGGKVVGAKITLRVEDLDGYKQAVVALSPQRLRADSAVGNRSQNRTNFVDPNQVHVFPAIDLPASNVKKEVTFEIEYGKGNKFKGGERLDVVSSWRNSANDRVGHNWG